MLQRRPSPPRALPLDPPSLSSHLPNRSPRPCGIPLETFRYSYLPATTSKIPSSPRAPARESSLSVIKDSQPLTISARRPFPATSPSSASALSNLPSRPASPLPASFGIYRRPSLYPFLLVPLIRYTRSPSSTFEEGSSPSPHRALSSAFAFLSAASLPSPPPPRTVILPGRFSPPIWINEASLFPPTTRRRPGYGPSGPFVTRLETRSECTCIYPRDRRKGQGSASAILAAPADRYRPRDGRTLSIFRSKSNRTNPYTKARKQLRLWSSVISTGFVPPDYVVGVIVTGSRRVPGFARRSVSCCPTSAARRSSCSTLRRIERRSQRRCAINVIPGML